MKNRELTKQLKACLEVVETGTRSAIFMQGIDGLAVMELIASARASNTGNGRRMFLGSEG